MTKELNLVSEFVYRKKYNPNQKRPVANQGATSAVNTIKLRTWP